uniref:transposase n=1 Tax=Vibrio natriegens TaxID=691 RepID=UPI00191BECC7
FEYAYLFGSVCPSKGIGEAIVVPWVNKDIMIEHLKQISAVTEKGRHAVVVMDGAGWHTEDITNDFKNVCVIKLSPYSPELNPIEQVWSWLRQRYLANYLLLITTTSSPKSAMHGIVFLIAPKELPKCAREDG